MMPIGRLGFTGEAPYAKPSKGREPSDRHDGDVGMTQGWQDALGGRRSETRQGVVRLALLLSTDDTRQLITMREAVDVLEDAYRALAHREATYRPRSDLVVPLRPGEDYWLATMEGAIRPQGVAAIRLRSDRFSPPKRKWAGKPGLFCGLVILYDLETAEPLAIIADGHLQVMRVAATSALGGRYLARPDSRSLGIIGSGWQAHDHARAYASLFPLQRIRVFSRTPAHREAFAAEMRDELGVAVEAVDSAAAAFEGADIVALCTTSPRPVLDPDWLRPGMFVSSIKYHREIGAANSGRFDVHVIHPPEYGWTAFRAGTPEEWAQGCDVYDPFRGDRLPSGVVPLQDVVAGLRPGRQSAEQITLMNNHAGMGLQLAAVGKLVYDRARQRGLGRELPTAWFLQSITT
jgi:alanine dehydrogenase